MENVLVAAGGFLAIIPGFLAFKEFGAPPEAKLLFGIGLEVVAFGTILGVLLRGQPRRKAKKRGSGRRNAGFVAATLAALAAYSLAYKLSVREHNWDEAAKPVVIPFFVSRWAEPELGKLVACAKLPLWRRETECAGTPAAVEYSTDDVVRTINVSGPDGVFPHIPQLAIQVTITVLFFLYSAFVALLVLTFTSLGLQFTGSEKRARTTRGPRPEPGKDSPAPADAMQ